MQVRDLLGGFQRSWNGNIQMDIKWDMKIRAVFVWLRVIFICVRLCRRQWSFWFDKKKRGLYWRVE